LPVDPPPLARKVQGPAIRCGKEFFYLERLSCGKVVDLEEIPSHQIVPTDLSGWQYLPSKGKVAVDPLLGRIAFPAKHGPKNGVWVSYHYD
jgi:hypothetical protein